MKRHQWSLPGLKIPGYKQRNWGGGGGGRGFSLAQFSPEVIKVKVAFHLLCFRATISHYIIVSTFMGPKLPSSIEGGGGVFGGGGARTL